MHVRCMIQIVKQYYNLTIWNKTLYTIKHNHILHRIIGNRCVQSISFQLKRDLDFASFLYYIHLNDIYCILITRSFFEFFLLKP